MTQTGSATAETAAQTKATKASIDGHKVTTTAVLPATAAATSTSATTETAAATAATAASAEVTATAATAVAATQSVLPVSVSGSAVRSPWKLQSSDEGSLRTMVARTCQDRGNTGQQ
jgi:hypothetical protein